MRNADALEGFERHPAPAVVFALHAGEPSVLVALWIAVKAIGQAGVACSRMVPQKPQSWFSVGRIVFICLSPSSAGKIPCA